MYTVSRSKSPALEASDDSYLLPISNLVAMKWLKMVNMQPLSALALFPSSRVPDQVILKTAKISGEDRGEVVAI
jgi:hypothetical protein